MKALETWFQSSQHAEHTCSIPSRARESLPLLKPQGGREFIQKDGSPLMRPQTLNTIPTQPFPPPGALEEKLGLVSEKYDGFHNREVVGLQCLKCDACGQGGHEDVLLLDVHCRNRAVMLRDLDKLLVSPAAPWETGAVLRKTFGQLGIPDEDGDVEEVGHGFLRDGFGGDRLGAESLKRCTNHGRCGGALCNALGMRRRDWLQSSIQTPLSSGRCLDQRLSH